MPPFLDAADRTDEVLELLEDRGWAAIDISPRRSAPAHLATLNECDTDVGASEVDADGAPLYHGLSSGCLRVDPGHGQYARGCRRPRRGSRDAAGFHSQSEPARREGAAALRRRVPGP